MIILFSFLVYFLGVRVVSCCVDIPLHVFVSIGYD